MGGSLVTREPTHESVVEDERRYDVDGKLYTKAEFRMFYGGFKQWDNAAAAGSSRRESGRRSVEPTHESVVEDERRYDTDGELYTKAEFRKFYGGFKQWD